jgi:hypothetical protein
MGTPTIDLDKFKAAKPWRDFTFWVALLTSLAMLLPVLDEAWRSRAFPTGGQLAAATSPLSAWLLGNGRRSRARDRQGRAVRQRRRWPHPGARRARAHRRRHRRGTGLSRQAGRRPDAQRRGDGAARS